MSFDKNKWQRERYVRRKSEGICVCCGKRTPVSGKTVCEECSQNYKERRREDYQFFKKKGICVICHRRKAEPGRVLCGECLEDMKHRQRRRTAQKAELLNLSL